MGRGFSLEVTVLRLIIMGRRSLRMLLLLEMVRIFIKMAKHVKIIITLFIFRGPPHITHDCNIWHGMNQLFRLLGHVWQLKAQAPLAVLCIPTEGAKFAPMER